MEKFKNETIISQLNWRYATKMFDATKKISDTDWRTLEEALVLAPSSFGLQPWNFLIVQTPELRKKLAPASWGQPQIEACSHLVVVTHLKTMNEAYIQSYIAKIAKTRSVAESELKGFKDSMTGAILHGPLAAHQSTWMARQAYIAMGTFMTVAALLQIDVCPMEGIDGAQYNEILDLKNSPYTAVAVMAAGYRSPQDQYQHAKKVRFDKSDIIKKM